MTRVLNECLLVFSSRGSHPDSNHPKPRAFDNEYDKTASEASTVLLDAVNYEDEAFDFDADEDAIMGNVQAPSAEDLDPVQEPLSPEEIHTPDASTAGVFTHPSHRFNCVMFDSVGSIVLPKDRQHAKRAKL